MRMKDSVLSALEARGNIPVFFSFGPDLVVRENAGIPGVTVGDVTSDETLQTVLQWLIDEFDGYGIRSFKEEKPGGNPFLKGSKDIQHGLSMVKDLADQGYYIMVSQTFPEYYGFIAGVVQGDRMELGARTTPRCVDDPNVDTAVLPLRIGEKFIRTMYSTEIPAFNPNERVEFTCCSSETGTQRKRYVLWELSEETTSVKGEIGMWPNHISREIGDKAYGLMMAHCLGHNVPFTSVFIPQWRPFSFGIPTNGRSVYTRTCPATKVPGHYPSTQGYVNPLHSVADPSLLDPDYEPSDIVDRLASVIIQHEVDALAAGVCRFSADKGVLIDGTMGNGEHFMLGEQGSTLPDTITAQVEALGKTLLSEIGDGEIEWVMAKDETLFVVQLCKKASKPLTAAHGSVVFDYKGHDDLERFRQFCHTHDPSIAIHVTGGASELSHVGQIAAMYGIPAVFGV